MAANIRYVLMLATVSGQLQLNVTSISVDRETASQAVKTLAVGYAGESQGAAMCNIKLKFAVPQAGFDTNFGPNMLALAPSQIFLLGPASLQLKATGQVIQDSLSQSVDSPATYEITMRAPFTDWVASQG